MLLDSLLKAARLPAGVASFARPPGNDNLAFAERVKAAIAEAAHAAGVAYSERELGRFAADASALARRLRAPPPR